MKVQKENFKNLKNLTPNCYCGSFVKEVKEDWVMTQNQIAYWNLQETKRSNVVREGETERNNRAVVSETQRANLAREKENLRHNTATEQVAHAQMENQAKRWRVQNGVDIANAVTGGIESLGNGVSKLANILA